MNITSTPATLHSLVILTSGKHMFSAKSMDDILRHLRGRLPTNRATRTIYSVNPITYDQAEQLADLPEFDHIEAHINLV
jgi:hypothetical protein